jgi:hypothetical protein
MNKSIALFLLMLIAVGHSAAQENTDTYNGSEELPVMPILLPELGSDQPEDDPMGTEDGPLPGGEPVPVDGGLSLLLAAGAAFGASRLRARK